MFLYRIREELLRTEQQRSEITSVLSPETRLLYFQSMSYWWTLSKDSNNKFAASGLFPSKDRLCPPGRGARRCIFLQPQVGTAGRVNCAAHLPPPRAASLSGHVGCACGVCRWTDETQLASASWKGRETAPARITRNGCPPVPPF